MPKIQSSALTHRQTIGYHDANKKYHSTDENQQRLNRIAMMQTGKKPQQPTLVGALFALTVVPNMTLARSPKEAELPLSQKASQAPPQSLSPFIRHIRSISAHQAPPRSTETPPLPSMSNPENMPPHAHRHHHQNRHGHGMPGHIRPSHHNCITPTSALPDKKYQPSAISTESIMTAASSTEPTLSTPPSNHEVDSVIDNFLMGRGLVNELVPAAIRYISQSADNLEMLSMELQEANHTPQQALLPYSNRASLARQSDPLHQQHQAIVNQWLMTRLLPQLNTTADPAEELINALLTDSPATQTSLTHSLYNIIATNNPLFSNTEINITREYIVSEVLYPIIPGLIRPELDKMEINSFSWGAIHAGLKFLSMTPEGKELISTISIEEAEQMGITLLDAWQQEPNNLSEIIANIFRLPVIFHASKGKTITMHQLPATEYDQYFTEWLTMVDNIQQKNTEFNSKVIQFQALEREWQSRPSMKDDIIRTGPYETIYKFSKVDRKLTKGSLAKLNNVDEDFRLQNEKLGNALSMVLTPLILSALSDISKNEKEFINKAILNHITVTLTRPRPPAPPPETLLHEIMDSVQPKNQWIPSSFTIPTDVLLLSAEYHGEQRIYSLSSSTNGYLFRRIDKKITEYFSLAKANVSPDNYRIEINEQTPIQLASGNKPEALAAAFSNRYRLNYVQALYDKGYEPTAYETFTQIARSVLLSLVPFYDCAQGIQSKQYGDAILSCSFDVIALIPFVGQAAKVGWGVTQSARMTLTHLFKHPQLFARAGMNVLKPGTLRKLAAEIPGTFISGLKSQQIPHKIWGLGKEAVRAFDPGLELLVRGGNKLIKTSYQVARDIYQPSSEQLRHIINMLQKNKNSSPQFKELVSRLESKATLSSIPSTLSDQLETARNIPPL